jgi:hypothetical protein
MKIVKIGVGWKRNGEILFWIKSYNIPIKISSTYTSNLKIHLTNADTGNYKFPEGQNSGRKPANP